MREDQQYAGQRLRGAGVDGHDLPACDRGVDERAVHEPGGVEFGGVTRAAGDLAAAVHARQRRAHARVERRAG
ncbi:MAG TPA: hypothetical protein VMJ11_21490 [Paraburkholderia sp.]|nr:hypothetical protein [Paraburkholderia sp.]HTR09177.1 hypothetical protein [Paraburkholderia sp.]